MNDEERFEEFYLFLLEKRQMTGDLVGLQLCAQCCSLERHKILHQGGVLGGLCKKNPSNKDKRTLA